MYASELRTCALGAVAAVLFGAGIGFGWHYFAARAGPTSAVAAVSRPAQRDARSPSPQVSRPPGPREAPAPDVTRLPVSARPNNRPDATQARGELKVTHAAHARRARQEAPSDGPDGDGQVPVH
jgi:hypothetical protein